MEKTSILNEVKKTKRYSKIVWSIVLISLLIGVFFLGKWIINREDTPKEIQYTKTIRKDIKFSVEEDGEIKSPKDFDLAFLTRGRVEKILVKEGQKIKAGEELAILDQQALKLEVKKAKSNIQSVYAQIEQQKATNTNLDFLQSEEEFNSKKSDILNTQKTTDQKVSESFDLALVQIETGLYRIQTALNTVDSVFGFNNDRTSSIQNIFHDSIRYNRVKNNFEKLSRNLNTQSQIWSSKVSTAKYTDISQSLWQTKILMEDVSNLFDDIVTLFANSNTSQIFTLTKIEADQSKILAEKERLHQGIQTLVVTKKNTENALINQKTQIIAAGNQAKQAKVKTQNAEKITQQKEISKRASLAGLSAQLSQAKTSLETANYNLSLATLLAPSNGEILDIKKELGEIISVGEPFIKILSEENFIVEIYIEELEISKIKIEQNAHIRIAALDDQVLQGSVSYIANNATEDSNGVVTYLVRLEITEGQELPIKEKMTASVEFIINEVKNAITVPIEAIFQDTNGASAILFPDLTQQVIETGLSDNTFIEIKKGLDSADIQIVKNPTEFINTEDPTKVAVFKELLPEIKTELEEMGFSKKEIQKIELGSMDEALTARLKEIQQQEKGGLFKMMKGS